MAKINLISQDAMVEVIAVQPGVRDAVLGEAGEIHWRASANLAAHRETGNAHIETSVDRTHKHWSAIVSLVDPNGNAKAIEFGHFLHNSLFPRYVAGLYVLSRAAGLVR
jgi:hypothetical protein